ncbi:MAG: short-chain dehydrogenase/reductase [Devosia sp.]|uniref:SDR family oxidoreductase n=1 Tax=Devosia sp. TaxID=1871048 RepID=UPI0026376035|nr:SDR family oxidoreductase [Devosia sp.]MDB5531112.1 short-chain dehydrogenase/reductase [Devosia sp.]
MDLGLNGKTALILGGSRGLGLGIARSLLAEGARVAMTSRSLDALAAARAALPAADRDRCVIVAADLADKAAPQRILDEVRAAAGEVDILVNNSGGPPTGRASEMDLAALEKQFHGMVQPLIAMTLAVLPSMRQRRWGRILTIASSGVVQPIAHLPISNTLRASLVGFMKTLASEVASDGVTVNILAPGRIATDRTHSVDAAMASAAGRSEDDIAQASAASIPAGRYGTVEEFAAVATFLAGASASYVTGSVIRVDGGAIRSI